MRSLKPIARRATWIAAALLVFLPCLMAFDFGGILRWSHLLASYGALLAGTLALIAIYPLTKDPAGRFSRRNIALFGVALLWLVCVWVQSRRVSPETASWLAPTSHAAFTQWLDPITTETPSSVPLSVHPEATAFYAATLGPLILIFWAASVCFDVPQRAEFMLATVSIGVGLQAIYGIWCFFIPDHLFRPMLEATSGFGSFVNRNNAALFLNLGLGASIGGVIWRLKQPVFSNFEEQEFEWDSLIDVLHDKWAMACGVSACFCFGAILLCGSGVGIIGLIFGTLALVNWFRSRITIVAIAVILGVFSIGIATVCLSSSMREYAFANLALSAESNATGPADARVYHWQDGWQAARESLPLGSGFGSYSDAYLPFQAHSPAAWFKHADNFWLELVVEQGYFGVLLFVAMLCVLGLETYRLSRSDDPVDAGLNSAMRFMIGAVVTTQFFDFGMLLPANCILFAVVAGGTVGRGQVVAYLAQMKPTEIPVPPSKVAVGLVSGAGVAAILLTMISLPTLRAAAWEESLLKSGDYLLATDALNRDALDAHVARLDDLLTSHPTAAVYNQSATFRHRVARLVDVDSQQLESQTEIATAYRETNLERKRLSPVDETDPAALRQYAEARQHATESLRRRPFSIDARARWIYLDFVEPNENRSSATMRQLAELQRREPKQLVRIGKLAEDSGHLRLARDCFYSAATVSPVFASEAVLFVGRNPTTSLIEAIPRHPTCIKRVSRYLIREDNEQFSLRDQATKYLRFAIETLDPQSEPTRVQRSRTETLIGDIHFHLEDWREGLDHYRLAAEASPADHVVRLTYVQRLLDTGYYDIALIEARKGRAQFPGNQRFQTLINRMAALRVGDPDDDDSSDAP